MLEQLQEGLSIVIPVYNSSEILPEFSKKLSEELYKLSPNHEIILVNDGSQDDSWKIICMLSQQYEKIWGINLMKNFGQHNALLCGIRTAKYDVIVTMDDDLEHPPDQIHILLESLAKGYDVVYGPPLQEAHGIWRDLASVTTKLALQSFMGAKTARNISAFRAFRTQLREAFKNYAGSFISIDVLLTWATTRFSAVRVRHDLRRGGVSNYTFRKLITHAVNMITGVSVLPLQNASLMGFGLTIFGIGVLILVIIRYLIQGGLVPGFSFLASIISIFSGSQLFAIGVIGEYLARIHFRMMDKPPYIIREDTGELRGLIHPPISKDCG